jgi:DNA invertase Pin-like site-specific DNA recombinase
VETGPIFARSLTNLVNALAEFEALGIAFVSLRDNLDLTTPSGRLMFQIIGAMAEFERSLIQERVKAGLRNARAKGKRLGRPRAEVRESKVNSLRAAGAPWREIAKQLGIGIMFYSRQRAQLHPSLPIFLHKGPVFF